MTDQTQPTNNPPNTDVDSDEPQERELMPGVFITDFRQRRDPHTNSAAADAESERKQKEAEDELIDELLARQVASTASSTSSSSTSTSNLERSHPSAFPLDIPNDVETIELELDALTKNLSQLLKSNQILEEELKESPDDQDFKDAIRENRIVIFRRSDRMQELRRQLQAIAPHRLEAINAQLAQSIDDQRTAAENEAASAQPDESEGGVFL